LTVRVTDPSWAVFVAEDSGRLVGVVDAFVATELDDRMRNARRFGRIDNLFVVEGRRGEGLGDQLLDAAETWAREQGLAEMELEVWEFAGAALKTYGFRGYRTIERRLAKRL
jgi:GNAT superfamily N-acetyltransferase